VKKSSQNQPVGATAPAMPERVSVAMTEIAEDIQEGLLALAVGAGLQVMAALMEADVTDVAGARGKHYRERTAVRHGR
jgi:putative transposase